MNKLLNGLIDNDNFKLTENGAVAHKSTKSALYDLFALGGAYRGRSNEDIVLLFKNAYEEDTLNAVKCLFYLRDILEGQGERDFFRICLHWLAKTNPEVVKHNLLNVPTFGRWDDLYCLVGTPVEKDMFAVIKSQLVLDIQSKTPSLLAKWLKSENTSSETSCLLGSKTRKYLRMTHKEYRKTLSYLRSKINVLEKLMSENRWEEIEFDKIPSRAGLVYRNAFARHDVNRRYEKFAKDENSTVNAKALYPYECVEAVLKNSRWSWGGYDLNMEDTDRAMINKYWDNLTDWFNSQSLNALCMVDTSGSMSGRPINVAISLGLYCAERAKGPFAGYYMSFASRPQLIKTEGVDFCDKVVRIYQTNLVDNTNLEAAFDLLLTTAKENFCAQEDIPENLIIVSDMEIDAARGIYFGRTDKKTETLMEQIRQKWENNGYKMPHLIYWNVDARDNTILDSGPNVSYVSGFSPVIFQLIMSGKKGYDLMMEKLNSSRYNSIVL